MKKRLLALLLTAMLLVTALPLAALPLLATEPEEEATFEYSSLYVKDGLVFMADFFENNELWNPAGEGHVTYDLSQNYNQSNSTSAFAPFVSHPADGSGMKQYLPVTGCDASCTAGHHDHAGEYQNLAVTLGNGFLHMNEDHHGQQYLEFVKATSATDTYTMQTVTRLNNDNSGVPFAAFLSYYSMTTDTANGIASFSSILTGSGSGSHRYTIPAEKQPQVTLGKISDITLQVNRVAKADAATDAGKYTYQIYIDLERKLAETDTIPAGLGHGGSFMGYNGKANFDLFAVRYYNRVLSADEIALNHFADLAKWFQLDVALYADLARADRIIIANLFADKTFENTTKQALQAELDATIIDEIYGILTEQDPSAKCVEFTELAKKHVLEISTLTGMPLEHREVIYDAVLALPETADKETVQAALDAAIRAVLEKHYGDFIQDGIGDYKKLYVKQDNLVLWMDFFASRLTENGERIPLYSDVSYEGWTGTGDYATRVVVPRPSGEADMKTTYVFKGAEYIKFLDIPDAYYAHTNIREYGDGCLHLGKNNSLTVKTTGRDKDITYQFVMNDNASSVNLQLDSFRFYFSKSGGKWNFGQYYFNSLTGETETYSIHYLGYGTNSGRTDYSNTALHMAGERVAGVADATAPSFDLTLVMDKNFGTDTQHYYRLYELTEYYDNVNNTPVLSDHPNKPIKVAEEVFGTDIQTLANHGPVTHDGIFSLKAFANGVEKVNVQNMTLQSNDLGSVGNSSDLTIYAIRTYDCPLTSAEIMQNHFADLAGYYGFNLHLYDRLTAEQQKEVHETLSAYALGGDRELAVQEYEDIVAEYLYDFGSNTAAAQNFIALCRLVGGLDAKSVMDLSPVTRERVFEIFAAKDTTVNWLKPVLQAELYDVIAKMKREHYAESIADKIVTSLGWQLRGTGDTGMRALFSVNDTLLAEAQQRRIDVSFGVMVARLPADSQMTAADLTISRDAETKEFKVPEGVILDEIYTTDTDYFKVDELISRDGKDCFAHEVLTNDYDERVLTVAYVVMDSATEGEVIYYTPALRAGNTEAQSLYTLSVAAKYEFGYAYPNIQKVINEHDEMEDLTIYAGDKCITEYTFVVDDTNKNAVAEINKKLASYLGIELAVVDKAELTAEKNLIYVGDVDNVFGDKCYGIAAQVGNLYFWYNSETGLDDTIAYIDEILRYAAANDMACVLPDGLNLVRQEH